MKILENENSLQKTDHHLSKRQLASYHEVGEFVRRGKFVRIQNFTLKCKFPRTVIQYATCYNYPRKCTPLKAKLGEQALARYHTLDPTMFVLTYIIFRKIKYIVFITYLAHVQFFWIVTPKFTNHLHASEQSSIMRNMSHTLHWSHFGFISL